MSAPFSLSVIHLDPDAATLTFKVRSTQSARCIALSRFFVLKTLAEHESAAISRQLRARTDDAGEACLEDPEVADDFITKTRITALANYIDWENIDHQDTLERLLALLELPATYDLKVWFTKPGHLAGLAVGDTLESHCTDGWIDDIEDLLARDPSNIYAFKGGDEQWYLRQFLDAAGEDSIPWTDAQAAIMARTDGLLPWLSDGRWGAVDDDGAARIPFVHDDIDYRDGSLRFKKDGRWVPLADLR